MESIEAQTHRRALKSHLPIDGLPIYDEVKYIHVARDGRDAALSFHNHSSGFTDPIFNALDASGLTDETIARPYPRAPADPAVYFGKWLREGAIAGESDGYHSLSYFAFEKSYWSERSRENLLFVHYNDLKAGLDAEMRRIAAFLSIVIPEAMWPSLVEAAGFKVVKEQGAALMPDVTAMFVGGKEQLFNKAEGGRWKSLFLPEDLAAYDAKLAATLPPDCIRWLESGSASGIDPKLS